MRHIFLFLFLCSTYLLIAQKNTPICRGEKVQVKETLYSIARKHNLSVAELLQCNPEMDKSSKLKEGQLILIPVKSTELAEYPNPTISRSEDFETLEWLNGEYWKVTLHPIKPKETFYSLSRFYDLPLEKLKSLNPGITQPNIGGNIVISKVRLTQPKSEVAIPVKEKPKEQKEVISKPDFTVSEPSPPSPPGTSPPAPVDPKDFDVAFRQWKNDGLKSSRMRGKCSADVALAPYEAACDVAPVGSLIQIRNLLSQQSVILKVKSALSAEEKKKEILVRIPPSILQQLGSPKESVLLVETLFFRSQ